MGDSVTGAAATYSRLAAAAFPLLAVAVAYLLYEDFDRRLHESGREGNQGVPAAANPPAASSEARDERRHVFEEVYFEAAWGENAAGEGTSGSGSTLEATVLYRTFLQEFMRRHRIKSVVDAGCGDWEFSAAIDWSGVDYRGYDVVASVIERNNARYATANVRFFVADVVVDDLPAADLLLSKHVLQHLPNADVSRFAAQFSKYRHVLLTNTVKSGSLSAPNVDIPVGAFRPLDPTRPPFDLRGAKLLTWFDGYHMQQVVHVAGGRTAAP